MSLTVRAAAKINLQLGVGPVRDDGFHPLATVYQAIGLYDDVTVADASDWSVEVHAVDGIDLPDVPLDDTNIAIRAGKALVAHHGLERAASIRIDKAIPVAGGLAGGSADAAATLLALDRLWDLDTSDEDLLRLAADLGSDVPFALIGGTASGLGRGEVVEPVLDDGSWWWVVVGSGTGLSTPKVYKKFDKVSRKTRQPKISEKLLAALDEADPDLLAEAVCNDLQKPALLLRPDLARTFEHGRASGALVALLSGSGPTVLLLAESREHAHEVMAAMQELGYDRLWAATGPVAGAHQVTHI